MQNPYGAVPQALENSRLALRDIMADHLATKQMAANLDLAVKKAETENAMVGANLERARMGQELDLAKMAQSQQQWQQGQDNWTKSFGLQQDKFKQDVLESNARMNLAKAAAARQSADTARRKIRDIAREFAPNVNQERLDRMLKVAGFDPDAMSTKEIMSRHVGLFTPVQRIVLQEDFNTLHEKYSKEQNPALKKQYYDQANQIGKQAQLLDYFHEKEISPKDEVLIFKQLEASGGLTPGTTYDQFSQDLKRKQTQSKETIDILNKLAAMNGQPSLSPTQPGGRRPLSAFGGTPQKAKIVPRPTKSAETQNSPIGILGY